MRNIKQAVSLVELAIVILILGILTIVVSGGSVLVDQAKLKMVMNEVKNIQSGFTTFQAKFGGMPGDMSNVTEYVPVVQNGDGNGKVEYEADSASSGISETGQVFQHLAFAELANADSAKYVTGNTLQNFEGAMGEASRLKGAVYIITYFTPQNFTPINNNHIAGGSKNVVRLGQYAAESSWDDTNVGYGVLTAKNVQSLDRKFDDGKARSGAISGHNEYTSAATTAEGCLTFPSGTTSDATGEASYNVENESDLCNVSFDLEPSS